MTVAYLQTLATTANTLVAMWNEVDDREQLERVNTLSNAWSDAVGALPEELPTLYRSHRERVTVASSHAAVRVGIL